MGLSNGLPKCTIQEADPGPKSFTAACASKRAYIWKKKSVGGYRMSRIFTCEVPEGCNIVDIKSVFMWESDVK